MFARFLVLFLLANTCFAAKSIPDNVAVNINMAQLADSIEKMYPLVLDVDLKNKPGQVRMLYEYLEQLEKSFAATQKHLASRSVGYAISYDVMQQFIEQIRLVLDSGEIQVAQGLLKSVPSLCGSCHSQDHERNKVFFSAKRNHFINDFDFAEFSFFTRNYTQAQKYYEKFLSEDNEDGFAISQALQRLLVIQAQFEKNLPKAKETLVRYKANTHFPIKVRLDLEQWILGLDKVIEDSKHLKHPITNNDLLEMISEFIDVLHRKQFALFASEKEKILFLVMRGWLYDYLNDSPPQEQVPVLLYWLAQCDRIINFTSEYALADLYLKECMVNHSSHPFAEKCYKSYQDFVTFSYTGSGGTDVPEDVLDELSLLREIVQKNKDK